MKLIISIALVISVNASATSTKKLIDNPFSDKGGKAAIEYMTFELARDFGDAINNYNLNRKKPNIDSEILLKLNLNKTKLKELPEIKKVDSNYLIQNGSNKIEFNMQLIIQGKFKLNGKEITIKKGQKSFAYNYQQIISYLINSAYAGDEWVADSESTRLLIASLMTLGSGYEKMGLMHLCILDCKERVSSANRAKLLERIKSNTESCQDSLSSQDTSILVYKSLGNIDYLKQVNHSDFKDTYTLIKAMSSVEKGKEAAAGINELAFGNDLAGRPNCYEMVRGTYMMLVHEYFSDTVTSSKADEDARAICSELDKLKVCLSAFHDNATYINDLGRANFKKENHTDPPAVPEVKGIDK